MILRERRVQRDRQELSRQGRERAGSAGLRATRTEPPDSATNSVPSRCERQIHRFAEIGA